MGSGREEEFNLVEYNVMYSAESQSKFQRNMSPPELATCFQAGFFPEEEGDVFVRNVG
jgi:hypothetical protein